MRCSESCRRRRCPPYNAAQVETLYTAGANFNRTVDATVRDPISGTPAHRANLCEVRPSAPAV